MNIPPPKSPSVPATILPENVQVVTVGELYSFSMPPPTIAALPENVQLVTVGDEEDLLHIPPPSCALLSKNVQFATVGDESELNIPPPPEIAVSNENVQFITVEDGEELSLGDFVLSGGEIAAMAVVDAVARLLPGVLGDEQSAEQDSFVDGLLDYPHYTRPEERDGRRVPDVLLSGDHARIAAWRHKQALGRTYLRRPDLVERLELSAGQRELLDEFLQEMSEQAAGPAGG